MDKIEHRPLDFAKIWRIAQSKTRKPVKFGTCCSQVMALFLDMRGVAFKPRAYEKAANAYRESLELQPDNPAVDASSAQ